MSKRTGAEMPAGGTPVRFQARDLAPLLFGLRTAAAALVALWLAMWLQLDNPRWAAWTVMALALPTRGQIALKGLWRMVGTLLGLAAGLVGVALFSQSSLGMGLFLAVWMSLAALVGGRLPALAAYGAALAGLTACLIALESSGAPLSAFALALERTSSIALGIVCAYAASALSEVFQGDPGNAAPVVFPQPSPATIRANAERVFVTFAIGWIIWVVTAWSSGPIFIVLVGALVVNFTTVPNVDRAAWGALWGVGLGQALGLILKYAVLTTTPAFGVLAGALFPFLFLGGVGMTDRRSLLPTTGFNISFLLAVEPLNPMQYDLAASLNEALAIFLGVTLVVAGFRFIRPELVWRLP